jgi:hypothetical protein
VIAAQEKVGDPLLLEHFFKIEKQLVHLPRPDILVMNTIQLSGLSPVAVIPDKPHFELFVPSGHLQNIAVDVPENGDLSVNIGDYEFLFSQ